MGKKTKYTLKTGTFTRKEFKALCVFCPDPRAKEPEKPDKLHAPWQIKAYAHLLPEGVDRLCEQFKICNTHQYDLKEAAIANEQKPDEAPF